ARITAASRSKKPVTTASDMTTSTKSPAPTRPRDSHAGRVPPAACSTAAWVLSTLSSALKGRNNATSVMRIRKLTNTLNKAEARSCHQTRASGGGSEHAVAFGLLPSACSAVGREDQGPHGRADAHVAPPWHDVARRLSRARDDAASMLHTLHCRYTQVTS